MVVLHCVFITALCITLCLCQVGSPRGAPSSSGTVPDLSCAFPSCQERGGWPRTQALYQTDLVSNAGSGVPP